MLSSLANCIVERRHTGETSFPKGMKHLTAFAVVWSILNCFEKFEVELPILFEKTSLLISLKQISGEFS